MRGEQEAERKKKLIEIRRRMDQDTASAPDPDEDVNDKLKPAPKARVENPVRTQHMAAMTQERDQEVEQQRALMQHIANVKGEAQLQGYAAGKSDGGKEGVVVGVTSALITVALLWGGWKMASLIWGAVQSRDVGKGKMDNGTGD